MTLNILQDRVASLILLKPQKKMKKKTILYLRRKKTAYFCHKCGRIWKNYGLSTSAYTFKYTGRPTITYLLVILLFSYVFHVTILISVKTSISHLNFKLKIVRVLLQSKVATENFVNEREIFTSNTIIWIGNWVLTLNFQ